MRFIAACGLVATLLGGCASESQFLTDSQSLALKTAEARARFELNCAQARGQVLSKQLTDAIQPEPSAPNLRSITQAQYTIGASGCKKRKVYVVTCPYGGDGCFAGVRSQRYANKK